MGYANETTSDKIKIVGNTIVKKSPSCILSFEITSGTEEALSFSAELGFIGDLTVGVNA